MKTLTLIITTLYFFLPTASFNSYEYSKTGLAGGSGGTGYKKIMPNDAEITFLEIYHGRLVDGITFYYIDGNGNEGHYHIGGYGGQRSTYDLGDNVKLIGISGWEGKYVDSIRFHFSNGESTNLYGGNGGDKSYDMKIPASSLAVGFYGRSGRVIDSIGIMYRI